VDLIEKRERQRVAAAEWRAKNPEKLREIQARYYRNHAEQERAESRAWGMANKEKKKAYWVAWYSKNRLRILKKLAGKKRVLSEREKSNKKAYANKHREHIRETQKKYREKNRERLKQDKVAYLKKNPEVRWKWQRKRRAAEQGVFIGNLDAIARWESGWKKRKTVTCYWCEKVKNPSFCHVDHIIPVSRGGSHSSKICAFLALVVIYARGLKRLIVGMSVLKNQC
jgi:hypothetical protein